jgi:hypothetical protein
LAARAFTAASFFAGVLVAPVLVFNVAVPVCVLRDAAARDFFTAAVALRAFVFLVILLTVFRSRYPSQPRPI